MVESRMAAVLGSRRTRTASLVLAGLALTALVGCPPGDKRVIETLPSPADRPLTPPPPTGTSELPPRPSVSIAGKRVIIDPGHGGQDPGAWKSTRSRLPEKTIVLDIGNQVARILQTRGAQVICTRTKDIFITLDQRADSADKYRVDLFVSIHADSAPNKNASGTEVHVYDAASGDSLAAARCMISAFKQAGIECRGMQRSNYHVLREHGRPAMLIETGFLTNVGDARELNSAAYRSRLAAAIADGATAYLGSR